MKIKNENLRTLNELLAQKHPPKLNAEKSYNMCLLAAAVKNHSAVLDATKMEVAKKYPAKVVNAQPGQLDPDRINNFMEDMKPILEREIVVPDVSLTFDEANEFELSPFELAELIEIGLVQKK